MPDNTTNLTAEQKQFIDWQQSQRPDPFTTPGNYATFADFYKAQGIDPYGAEMQKFAQQELDRARGNATVVALNGGFPTTGFIAVSSDPKSGAYYMARQDGSTDIYFPDGTQQHVNKGVDPYSNFQNYSGPTTGNYGVNPTNIGPWNSPSTQTQPSVGSNPGVNPISSTAPSPFTTGPGASNVRTASANTGSAQTANQYTTDYDKIVRDAYAQIGRTGVGTNPNQIDQTGLDYWTNQLKGGMSPDDFAKTFGNTVNYLTSTPIEDIKKNSAANNQPNEAVISYVDKYLNDKPVTISTNNWKANTNTGNQLTNTNQVSQLGAASPITLGSGAPGSMASAVRTVGAGSAQSLDAGSAPYRSALIKSLRNSTGGDYSNNPGVNLSQPSVNLGAISLKPTGGVNNPGVLNPGGGTPAPQPPTQPPTPTPGRGTVGTPADMPAGYAGYWSSKPVGSTINWAGGTLTRIDANNALYTGPNGERGYISPQSDLNQLALTYPGIAKQWLIEFGFVPTQLTYEGGGG